MKPLSNIDPQTMLATKYAQEPIRDPFGFLLRLRTATKAWLQERQMGYGD